MLSTSHLPPCFCDCLFPSFSHAHTLFLCLSRPVRSVVTLKFLFLSFRCFLSVSYCDIFSLVSIYIPLFLSLSHSCVHAWMSIHTHTHTCVVESEKVSVLFSGQLGLIFSTFCFHTLTDSLQAEKERERHAHTHSHIGETETSQSECCIQRLHNDDRCVHTQPRTNKFRWIHSTE